MTLSPAPAPEQEGLTQEWVSVPKAILLWLHGEGPDHEGSWFDESRTSPTTPRRRYAWRSVLRAWLAASPTPPAGRKATPDMVLVPRKVVEQVLYEAGRNTDSFNALRAALAAGGAA